VAFVEDVVEEQDDAALQALARQHGPFEADVDALLERLLA
jgi:hypothetical protein